MVLSDAQSSEGIVSSKEGVIAIWLISSLRISSPNALPEPSRGRETSTRRAPRNNAIQISRTDASKLSEANCAMRLFADIPNRRMEA